MKPINIFLILLLLVFHTLAGASTLHPTKSLGNTYNDNNEALQNVYDISNATTYSAVFGVGSIDPFNTKAASTKFAQSKIIRVFVQGQKAHIKMGSSTIANVATVSDYILATNTEYYFSIDTDRPYVRLWWSDPPGSAATPTYWVSEIGR